MPRYPQSIACVVFAALMVAGSSPSPAQDNPPQAKDQTGQPAELPPVTVTTTAQKPKAKKPTNQQPVAVAAPQPSAAPPQQEVAPEKDSYGTGGALGEVDGYGAPSALSATKTDTPLMETPQAVSVVTKDLITDRKADDVREALATVPGFSPSVEFLFDQAYSLRGFLVSSDSFYQKYRDGRRMPQAVPIAPDLLERIEVIKGPASVLYGQIEPGGLVNHVSKRAQLGGYGGYVQQDFASFSQLRTIVDVNAGGHDAAIRLPGVMSTGDSFRDVVEYESYDIAPSATWRVSPDTRISLLSSLGYREKTDDTIGKPIVNGTVLDVPRSRFLGDPSFVNDVGYGSVTAEIEHDFSADVTLRSAYSYFNVDRHAEYALNNFIFPFAGRELQRFGGVQDDKLVGHATYHDLSVDTTMLGFKSTVLMGVDAFWSQRDNFNTIGFMNPINVDDPTYDSTINPPFIFDNYRGNIASRQYGLYVQDQITLAENLPGIHKLALTVGGRWDWAKDDFDPSGFIFFAPVQGLEIESEAFSPRGALLWMPTSRWSIYGSYSESFNPQDPEAAGALGNNVDPTEAEQYEVGTKYQLLPSLAASIALFDITKTNIPGPDPNVPLLQVLTGEVRSRGIEVELTGEVLPGWQIAAGYAKIDTEITKDDGGNVGNRLLAAPTDTFGLWTGYTIQPGSTLAGFGFGVGATYVSDVFADNENTVSLPSYTVYDAALWYRPDVSYGGVTPEYSLNVKNLTDEHYFLAGNGFSAVQDGTARTVLGSIKMKF